LIKLELASPEDESWSSMSTTLTDKRRSKSQEVIDIEEIDLTETSKVCSFIRDAITSRFPSNHKL
jgi:hypothetical protein